MAKKDVLLFGSRGQVGTFLTQHLSKFNVIIPQRGQADFRDPEKVYHMLNNFRPLAIVNAAAYTDVRKAEEEKELAFNVNAKTPSLIAKWCADKDIPFITYSTDYVYASNDSHYQTEDEPLRALNVYGQSKQLGDELVAEQKGKHIILRTSWVYSEVGNNFLKTMVRLIREKEVLKVVSDQVGAPTYAHDISFATVQILNHILSEKKYNPGVYHLCNSGETSWFGFAQAIWGFLKLKNKNTKLKEITPQTTLEYNKENNLKLSRPLNSRLSTQKIKKQFGIELKSWKSALEDCFERLVI
ncbi:MAG: dTDP-4-dehydrorhamnose reductase [Oligoflexia bacterium]|nr:dTDP-4-dehydrorhamnose reductase [Oligoflexia bacterium]